MTGGAFSLSTLVSASSFEIIEGEAVIGGLHGATRHFFCPHCMSWLFTRPEGAEAFVNVRTPMFDDPSGLDPYMETMTSAKLPWVTTPAVASFDEFPGPDEFGPLIEAFARRGG
jgi:hypothetical protein